MSRFEQLLQAGESRVMVWNPEKPGRRVIAKRIESTDDDAVEKAIALVKSARKGFEAKGMLFGLELTNRETGAISYWVCVDEM